MTITSIRTVQPNSPIYMLPGIGRHTPHALKMYGINTISEFALFTEGEIVRLLGKSGKSLLRRAKYLARTR